MFALTPIIQKYSFSYSKRFNLNAIRSNRAEIQGIAGDLNLAEMIRIVDSYDIRLSRHGIIGRCATAAGGYVVNAVYHGPCVIVIMARKHE